MAKPYVGKVSVVMDTKGRVTIKGDAEGKFSDANASEAWETMLAFGKKLKAEVKVFRPEGGTIPRILDGYGKPYMALLSPLPEGNGRKAVTKLA
jgi:hypothetical protein